MQPGKVVHLEQPRARRSSTVSASVAAKDRANGPVSVSMGPA